MDQAHLLPYLPEDNLDGGLTVASNLADRLGVLLSKDEAAFWAVVKTDRSIPEFVETFLQYCLRPHDLHLGLQGARGAASVPAAELPRMRPRVEAWYRSPARQLLLRRAFALLHRLATPPKGTSGAAHADLLASRGLLTLPQVMDLAAVFGAWSPAAVSELLSRAAAASPALLPSLATAGKTLVSNLTELRPRLAGLVGRLETRANSTAAPKGDEAALSEEERGLLDGVAYVHDLAATLTSTLSVMPAGLAPLLQGGPVLLDLTGDLHEKLVRPCVDLSRILRGDYAARLQHSACCAAASLQALAFQILKGKHLEEPSAPPPGPSKSSLDKDAAADAAGEAFLRDLARLSSMSDMSDSLALAGLDVGQGAAAGGRRIPPLLQAVSRRFDLERWVATAAFSGLMHLDDAQFDYLLALCGGPVEEGAESRLMEARRSASRSTGAAPGSSRGAAPPVDSDVAAVEQSLLSQIKDVFGDSYGDGYLLAMLDHFGGNPESVVNCLLEGNVPTALKGIDPLSKKRPSGLPSGSSSAGPSSSSSSSNPAHSASSGKVPGAHRSSSLWMAAYAGLDPRTDPVPGAARGGAAGGSTSGGAAARRSEVAKVALGQTKRGGVDRRTAKLLDSADRSVLRATLRLAEAIEDDQDVLDEYEDEYDDSFDDMHMYGPGGDGDETDLEGQGEGGGGRGGARAYAAGPTRFSGSRDAAPISTPQRGAVGIGAPPGNKFSSAARPFSGNQGAGGASSAAAAAAAAATAAGSGPRPGGPQPQQQQQGSRGRAQPQKQIYVVDGRVYNYNPNKAGQVAVTSMEGAERVLHDQEISKQEIMGLGAGGNKARFAQMAAEAAAAAAKAGPKAGAGDGTGAGPSDGPGGSGGRGGGRGGGGGRGHDHGWKDKNKAAVGNHHRKDRAIAKMSKGMI